MTEGPRIVFILSALLCAACATDAELSTRLVGSVSAEKPAVTAETQQALARSADWQASVYGTTTSLADIEDNGPANACYYDREHHVAEFLYQNPQACYWSVDESSGTIATEPVPQPPSDAIVLPRPTGGDDTRALSNVINQNAGRAFVGAGVYTVNKLSINVSADIFNMPMKLKSGGTNAVIVNAPDVRIFSSPIDAQNSATARVGFTVVAGADRFTLVESGVSNIRHSRGHNASGVFLRGVSDFHIACNTFENITNSTSDKRKTARANAIWMNGRNREDTSGGVISNNHAHNLQSNGARKDAEFFTIQNYRNTDPNNPLRLYANRAIDAGKRFSKHQASDARVLSNYHEWSTSQGPLGKRSMLAHVAVLYSDNVAARNNRVKIGATGGFDYVFNMFTRGNSRQNDVHYDCNNIEVSAETPQSSRTSSKIIAARVLNKSDNSTGYEALNSSANNNRVHGAGSVRNMYWFGSGYDDFGGSFETSGNEVEVELLNSLHQR